MSKLVEFYYDFGSPAAYLAWSQLPDICAEYGGVLQYKPILLGGVFQISGNQTPVNIPAKRKWLFDDLTRYAELYDVPFKVNPHFIVNTLGLMRGAMWAWDNGCIEPYNKAMFEAMWVEELPMEEPAAILDVLVRAGLDGQAALEAVQTPEIKSALIEATSAAAARGVFGVPTIFVGGAMHFGQDRLDWVRRALDHAQEPT